jgi:hypothetical protein
MSAKYPYRRKPFTGLAAFHHTGVDTAPSQAAHLLHMGNQLRQSDEALVARAKTQRRNGFVQPAAMEELNAPVLTPNARLVPREESQARLSNLHGYALRATPAAAGDEGAFEAAFQKTAARVFMQPVAAHAADLFAMGLEHPHALVRIAAAISGLRLSTQPQHCVRELVKGLKSADELERTLAATGLARHHPEHPALRALARGRSAKLRKKPPETLMLVHGTFASDSPWYQPGGDFFSLVQKTRPDLYAQPDFFRWSGAYSDGARQQGALDLQKWVTDRHEEGLDLMGHSHGGNIMFKATEMGLKLGKLVVLSCPVHVDKYFPDFNNLKAPLVSVRVKHDLVILADGGGQLFTHPDITEIVLPIWFDHSATHDPKVWQDNQLVQKVKL